MGFELERRVACPTCGAVGGATLVDLPFAEAPLDRYLRDFYRGRIDPATLAAGRYELVECSGCGLLYQREVPGADLLRALYDGPGDAEPAAARSRRDFDDRRRYAFQVEQLLKHFGGHPADVEVLDYGMGWGNWLLMAQAYGCRTSGAEVSSSRLDVVLPGVEVLDPEDLPVGRFHFVNTEQVFEHLTDPRAVGERLVAALRPGGLLRISVPNASAVPALLADPDWDAPKGSARSLNAVAPLEHVNGFTHRALVTFGTSLGLEPFDYPLRQFVEPWERVRFVASAVVHAVRRPRGTLLLFRKP